MDQQHPDTGAIEHVFQAWDDALGAKDLDASVALYHPDARRGPLVCHLLGTDDGVVRVSEALRRFVEQVFAHQPPQRRRFRTGFLTDGARVTWEFPRESPDSDQMDIVEVMEIRDGLIAHHRVYWGWFGVNMLKRRTPQLTTCRLPGRRASGRGSATGLFAFTSGLLMLNSSMAHCHVGNPPAPR